MAQIMIALLFMVRNSQSLFLLFLIKKMNPIINRMIDGQRVMNANNPKPMGFGLSKIPMIDNNITIKSGPTPSISKAKPMLSIQFFLKKFTSCGDPLRL
ncbi:hypothetical protein HN419_03905 [Candidatus Woesearchaeota archaeon]|nr:hypothetical protein [Candidatus Woesearchaeota archaeon]MBT4697332.1 hypothetical protein [Candidatus Woesearchaeota archaeon]MBT4717052.1 hypothetical protein [Candidatus Woesearchaeota archaeon]